MWVVTEHGFVSLVEDRDDPNTLQVRARVPEDITATFAGAVVYVAEGGDYRYRARVNRQEVADTVHAAVMTLSYQGHFKDVALGTSPPNDQRYDAYYDTWHAMAQMQDYAPYSRTPRPPRPRWEDEDDFYYREENE